MSPEEVKRHLSSAYKWEPAYQKAADFVLAEVVEALERCSDDTLLEGAREYTELGIYDDMDALLLSAMEYDRQGTYQVPNYPARRVIAAVGTRLGIPTSDAINIAVWVRRLV